MNDVYRSVWSSSNTPQSSIDVVDINIASASERERKILEICKHTANNRELRVGSFMNINIFRSSESLSAQREERATLI